MLIHIMLISSTMVQLNFGAYTQVAFNQHTPWFKPKIEQIYAMALDSEVP